MMYCAGHRVFKDEWHASCGLKELLVYTKNKWENMYNVINAIIEAHMGGIFQHTQKGLKFLPLLGAF